MIRSGQAYTSAGAVYFIRGWRQAAHNVKATKILQYRNNNKNANRWPEIIVRDGRFSVRYRKNYLYFIHVN